MRLVIKFDFLDTFLNMKIKIRTAVHIELSLPVSGTRKHSLAFQHPVLLRYIARHLAVSHQDHKNHTLARADRLTQIDRSSEQPSDHRLKRPTKRGVSEMMNWGSFTRASRQFSSVIP